MWRHPKRYEYRHICQMEKEVRKHRYVMGLFWMLLVFFLLLYINADILFHSASTDFSVFPFLKTFLMTAPFYALYCCVVYLWRHRIVRNEIYVQRAVCVWKKEEHYGRLQSSVTATITLITEDGSKFSNVWVPYPIHTYMDYESELLVMTPDPESLSELYVYPLKLIQ